MDNGEVLKAVTQLQTELGQLRADLLDQIHGVGAQLHQQIEDLDKRVDDRLVAIEKRLTLQGGLVQSGSRAMTRFIEWTEGMDSSLFRYDRRLSHVEKRLADLEQKSS